jgi:hypothetical protein
MSIVSVSCLLACSPGGVEPDGDDGAAETTGDAETDDSTSTSDGDPDGGSATPTTTGGFVPDVEDIGFCNPGVADDCPDGEKCTAYVMEPGYCCVDTNACVPIIGDKQFGDACTRTEMNDDCDNTLFCMTTTSGATGDGVCLQLCDMSDATYCANVGQPEAVCTPFNDGVLPLCEGACDPLTQDCGMAWGCYPVDDGFTCAGPAYDPGEGQDGSDCFTIQSCEPGLACIAGDVLEGCTSASCCTSFCDTAGSGNECSAPESCEPYFEPGMAPPGYETVGLCILPA